MNRRDRRIKGKKIYERIQVLRNSRSLGDPYLKDITEEDKALLKEGKHENESLQKKFNIASKLATELIFLEGELFKMKKDLEAKRLQGKHR